MDPERMRDSLLQIFEQEGAARGARDAVAAELAPIAGDVGKLKQVRAAAFEIARSCNDNTDPDLVLGFLEQVVRAIEQAQLPAISCRCFFAPRDPCVDEICALLQHAAESADLCIFTITDDRIVDEIERAHRRGVKVRILTDDDKSEDRGSDVRRLARAGIPVRMDRDPAHMHHKFAVIDSDTLLTGSYNWTRSASNQNAENVLVINHPGACAQFSQEFERLWQLGRH